MGTSGRAEAVAEAQEVSLVDRVEHFGHRALDDLVLERGKAKGPLASISFRDVGAEHRPGPVLSAVDACVQALEISLQVLLILLHRYPIDSRTRRAPLSAERSFERVDIDVMQQGREPQHGPSDVRDRHAPRRWRHDIPGDQKREYSGYTGSYTYDGKQLVTTVDAAPDPGRIGTKQPRGVRFENGLMILIPPPRVVDGVTEHREIAWEKVSDV
jgi:hypothetical protein